MRHRRSRFPCLLLVSLTILFAASRVAAQGSSDSEQGTNVGHYNVRQSLEFGYRYTNFTGSQAVYDTFVNLGSGVRLFDQSLEVRSLTHRGLLFDNLSMHSFGYGGDPNDLTRLRISKGGWYDFTANFRRDKYFWDYNLLANPLNPSSFPQATSSPHQLNLVRRMTDFDLALFPKWRVGLRLGYARNIEEGPSFTTFDGGTAPPTLSLSSLGAQPQLFQSWKTAMNSYRFGFDFRLLPRTVFSYNQFLQYFRQDNTWMDRNLTFQLPNGTPVDLGIVFNSRTPCTNPVVNQGTNPPTADPGCNGTLSYTRVGRPRTFIPTEQFRFHSSYFRNIEMTALASYSSSDNDVRDFNELFAGNVNRTLVRGFTAQGPTHTKRASVTAEGAMTWTVTSKFRILDTFRYTNFRLPGSWLFSTTTQFAQAPLLSGGSPSMLLPPGSFDPTNCPPPFSAPSCPQHNDESGPDVASGIIGRFLGESDKFNTFELAYDFTNRFGGRLGYKYGHRNISDLNQTFFMQEVYFPGPTFFPGTTTPASERGDCAAQPDGTLPDGCTVQPDGSVIFSGLTPDSDTSRNRTPINQHSLIVGLWARPTDQWRMSFDMEWMSADHSFTRISPRQLQTYRFHTTYRPRLWMSLDGSLNILERRNNVTEVEYRDHNRSIGFSSVLSPSDRFSFDVGYNYNNVRSLADVCFALGFTVPAGDVPCVSDPSSGLVGANSAYRHIVHFGYVDLLWKPWKRITATLGYAGSFTNGTLLFLNPADRTPLVLNSPPGGTLQYNYHKPHAGLAIDLGKGFTYRASWGYYGYNEKQAAGLTGSRDFRGNLATFSIRYAF